jgi:hypothetical protein
MAEQHLDLSGIKTSLLQLFDSSILNRLGETIRFKYAWLFAMLWIGIVLMLIRIRIRLSISKPNQIRIKDPDPTLSCARVRNF